MGVTKTLAFFRDRGMYASVLDISVSTVDMNGRTSCCVGMSV